MKSLVILLLAGWAVCAQTPAPSGKQPAAPPAALPDDIPDTAVVAECGGEIPLSMGDVRKYIDVLPQESQSQAKRDPKTWIKSWCRMVQMAHMAETDKLDQQSPLKEQLAFQRMLLMAQAEMQDKLNNTQVDSPDIAQRYDRDKEKYKQVKVNAIYIAFGEKGLKEAEAKAKAEKLLTELRGGADFAKLAHENSDDETSKAKDGYFATLSPSDNIPDALRSAVFQLKKGETSEPVRQPNGFYLLRAEEITYKPLSEVRDQIFTELQKEKFQEWLNGMAKSAEPKFVNPAFPAGK